MKRSELERIIEEEIHTVLESFLNLNEAKKAATGDKGAAKKDDAPAEKKSTKTGKRKVGGGRKTGARGGDYDSAGTVPTVQNRKMTSKQVEQRAKLGQQLMNLMRRGKRENNVFYKKVVAHAKKKLGMEGEDETPSIKQIYSFVWAIASDMVLKGKEFGSATVEKRRRAKARKEKEKAEKGIKSKIKGGAGGSGKSDADQGELGVKGSSKANPARKSKQKSSSEPSKSNKPDSQQLDLF